MAKLNLRLKHGDVDTTQKAGGGALPDGFYRFEVDEMQDKPHHDGRPGYKLDVVLEVIEPDEFKGRKIFVDFGVDDPNHSDWEGWGREALARFLRAIDFPEEQEFDDTDDAIGRTGIAKVGLDRKRSDSQKKRFSKLWAYVYPEDERDCVLGPFDRQEEWKEPAGGGREERGRSSDRGSERSRDDRGASRGREERGREERGGRDDRGSRDSDRDRGRDRDDGRSRGRDEDKRGAEDDDIPFNEPDSASGDERPKRGGGTNPWNKNRR